MIFSFKNKKSDDIEDVLYEADELSAFSQDGSTHPDTLTADEILSGSEKNAVEIRKSALERLKDQVTVKNRENPKKEQSQAGDSDFEVIDELISKIENSNSSDKQSEEENTAAPETEQKPENEPQTEKTLLDKCMPYIVDNEGRSDALNEEPLYKLESVAEILKSESERFLENLSERYGVDFVDSAAGEAPAENTDEPDITPAEEKAEPAVPEKPAEPEESKEEIPFTHTISDIDIPNSPFYEINPDASENAGTITFTPITDEGKNKVFVSTNTRKLDFTEEFAKTDISSSYESERTELERSDFEEYVPDEEFTDVESGKALIRKFGKQKKRAFVASFGSIIFCAAVAFFKFPFMSGAVIGHTKGCMITAASFVLVEAILNFDVFLSLKNMFSKRSACEVNAALAFIFSLPYVIYGIMKNEIITDVLLLLSLIFTFSAVSRFIKAAASVKSFKQIFSGSRKHAIKLISDPAITVSMSRGAVEGDTLIAAAQPTVTVEDYMKYSTYDLFLNGRAYIINIASVALALLLGFSAAAYFGSILYGFFAASAVQCIAALPVLFFIDRLPLYSASKRLALVGAMIAGKTAAEQVEQANAVVINSKDLFPSGTVTLHKMQLLSDEDPDDIIVRAVSLTEALKSPLGNIFRKIAGESSITEFPVSDTMKYEENLGISGWVDDRLLFIGNRTLMEAHGIPVPDVETDHNILRQGYFPVYVASQNKACVLLWVRYRADAKVAGELRKLTGDGVTLLMKNSDPNLTPQMICDYFGLYEDSVSNMSAAGTHIYDNTVSYQKSCPAPAAFKMNMLGLPTILNCAARIRKSNTVLTVMYIISAIFGILLFGYTSFSGAGTPLGASALLIYGLAGAVITYILYLIQKP